MVAAPVFPLGNADAPGGPDEADIVNQPRDMSFVITRLLALSAGRQGPLAGLIDARQVAVSGQSDGGETALAMAYDQPYRDDRVRAAIILSGAQIPSPGGSIFRPRALRCWQLRAPPTRSTRLAPPTPSSHSSRDPSTSLSCSAPATCRPTPTSNPNSRSWSA